MSWHWSTTPDLTVDEATDLGVGQEFDAQGDAESWLGEFYPDLAAAGITAVFLYEEDRLVYGPMDLSA